MADDIARSHAILDDGSERLAHLLQIRRLTIEPEQRRLSVAHRRGDGLFHFVGDRRRELSHGRDTVRVRQLHLHLAVSALALACVRFRPLAFGQIEHEGDGLPRFLADRGTADQHGHAAAVFAEVFLLTRLDGSGGHHVYHTLRGVVAPFRRRQVRPAHATGDDIFTIVLDDAKKCVVGLENPPLHIPDEDADDVGVDQPSDLRFTLFDLSLQSRQRFQVRLQHVAEVQQKLEISLAIVIPFIIANANRPEDAAIRPTDRNAEVRDHSQSDMRVHFPCVVLESVRDKQRLTGPHDGRAIRSRIGSARPARISFGCAGDEDFDLRRIDLHYRGGGNVHDFGKQIHDLLPFSDDFRGHFDGMCWGRAGWRRTHDLVNHVLGITGDALARPVVHLRTALISATRTSGVLPPPQRPLHAFEQSRLVERLAQKIDCSRLHRSLASPLLREGSNKNDRLAMIVSDQAFLQLEAAHAGHLHVGNDAGRLAQLR